MISYGVRHKKPWWWAGGAILLPLAFVGIFVLIAHEVEKFTGQKAEWKELFKPSPYKLYPKNGEPVDSTIVESWPALLCTFGTETTDTVLCLYSPGFSETSIEVNRIGGSFTKNAGEASFRVEILLNQAFKGDLVLESRNYSGELLSRNAVYVFQQTPAAMSIEFRLKDFVVQRGNYLLLNFQEYE